jgi:hypothetical protein
MPKERSHLLIAREILGRLNNAALRQLIERHAAAYYLGAIIPDLKNYDLFGRVEFAHVADFIHDLVETKNSGLIFQMLSKLKQEAVISEELMVFILGYITHAVSDAIFHPLVYYFTGNYYDSDPRQRARSLAAHIAFETLLELALFRSAGETLADFEPAQLCQLTLSRRRAIFRYFARILSEECNEKEEKLFLALNRSYPIFLIISRWFPRPLYYHLARFASLLSFGRLRKYIGFFHPPRLKVLAPLFTEPVEFKHPFTGENITTSVESLKDQAIRLGVSCLNTAYAVCLGALSLEQLQALLENKNMNTGTRLPASQLKYCSPAGY